MKVYLITNTITQKCYVGKTGVGVSRPWTVHKCNAQAGRRVIPIQGPSVSMVPEGVRGRGVGIRHP